MLRSAANRRQKRQDVGELAARMGWNALTPHARQSQAGSRAFPAGDYGVTLVDDHVWTDVGDLDACKGMVVNGTWGYYVTAALRRVLRCICVGMPVFPRGDGPP